MKDFIKKIFSKLTTLYRNNKVGYIVTIIILFCSISLFFIFISEIINFFFALFINKYNSVYLFGGIAFLVLIFYIIYFIWTVPKKLLENTSDEFKTNYKNYHSAIKDYRTTNAQIVAGVFFLLTAFLTYTQIQNEKIATNDRLTLDQYQKAIDQLKDTVMASKFGGIYSLEKIMNENEYYHWKIIEILSNYIREKRFIKYNLAPKEQLDIDIQTILTVLGRRNSNFKNNYNFLLVDLSYSNLYRANFAVNDTNGRNFKNYNFKNSNLQHTYLTSAHFENAYCAQTHFDTADCLNAHFENADCRYADFTAAIHLTAAQLSKAKTLYEAKLDIEIKKEIEEMIKKDYVKYGHLFKKPKN
ncbi:MAG: pentapeptide repeat-containing protein [Ignavibacteriae bacterium]|nr:pentapeptide repeat-containing protein [Ignavibacteriota bacterium]